MADPGPRTPPSPWHAGERAIQAREGVLEKMAAIGTRVIRDHMPDQHRTFYGQLPFLLLGTVDATGAPWASVLEGVPGFVSSPDPRTLSVTATPSAGDPARDSLTVGAAVGLLGIELHTRRRNRMNGTLSRAASDGFQVTVDQSFGNCPQYIHTRDASFARPPGTSGDAAVDRGSGLDDAARALLTATDTLFAASYVDEPGSRRGVDVSHRGGKPGFVRVAGDVLTIPDFAGNLQFNTLGNLIVNPRAGVLVVDFERGDLLQLTGRTEVVFDGDEIASFHGAERLWRLTVEQRVWRRDALALRWRGGEPSPRSLATGSW